MSDLIDRQAAIDATWEEPSYTDPLNVLTEVRDRIKALPPAQPEQHLDEWCDSCKEYDKKRHSCPRWNKVIKNTVEELKSAQPVSCEDAVSRKDCLKALSNMMDTDGFRNGWAVSRANVECMLKSMPPVTPKQHIDADGTLWVTVTDIGRVTRVIVDEDKSKFCRQFYMDAQLEPCEDAVSREEVLNCLEWQYPDKLPRTKIMELPPVTPKQRTGKWIPQDHNKRVGNISTCVYYLPICSKCGKVGNDTYKYCPRCGAKMTEGDTE